MPVFVTGATAWRGDLDDVDLLRTSGDQTDGVVHLADVLDRLDMEKAPAGSWRHVAAEGSLTTRVIAGPGGPNLIHVVSSAACTGEATK